MGRCVCCGPSLAQGTLRCSLRPWLKGTPRRCQRTAQCWDCGEHRGSWLRRQRDLTCLVRTGRLCAGLPARALQAWVAGGQTGEIVLLQVRRLDCPGKRSVHRRPPSPPMQENNSFFAYEPILKALQQAASRTLPLQQYLCPPVSGDIA